MSMPCLNKLLILYSYMHTNRLYNLRSRSFFQCFSVPCHPLDHTNYNYNPLPQTFMWEFVFIWLIYSFGLHQTTSRPILWIPPRWDKPKNLASTILPKNLEAQQNHAKNQLTKADGKPWGPSTLIELKPVFFRTLCSSINLLTFIISSHRPHMA